MEYMRSLEERKHQLWKVAVIGELLAAAPLLAQPPSITQFTSMLHHCLNQYAQGNFNNFARLLRVNVRKLWGYFLGYEVPYFDAFLHLCETLAIRPLEFFTAEMLESMDLSWFDLDSLPYIPRGRGKGRTPEDVKRIRQALKLIPFLNVADLLLRERQGCCR